MTSSTAVALLNLNFQKEIQNLWLPWIQHRSTIFSEKSKSKNYVQLKKGAKQEKDRNLKKFSLSNFGKKMENLKIILYGKNDVGKSATLVRLVTGRFITEYSHEKDITTSYTIPRIDNQGIVEKWKILVIRLTLTRPLRRKLRMRWFFDVSKVNESSFFNRTSLTALRFLMRIFWKIPI